MIKIFTLQVNPFVKLAHYKFYFNCSHSTAWRNLCRDKSTLGKDELTYFDFYRLHDAFPDPKFKPRWVEMEVPKSFK